MAARGLAAGRGAAGGLALLLGLAIAPGPASAEAYRLAAGDEVRVVRPGAPEPLIADMQIDSDGQIRLPDLGAVSLSGATLDEAEARLAEALEARAGVVDPRVSLSMLGYAPVVVAGDVGAPGGLDYIPGMTVATALALAGGGTSGSLTRGELGRASAAARGALQSANLGIAVAAATLARHDATLDQVPMPEQLPAELQALVPSPEAVDMERLLAAERDILNAQRERSAELLGFWEAEIAAIERQISNYDARIEVQQEIVESAALSLEDARALQERGLQTTSRVADAEKRDADARSRALELEAVRISAEQAVSRAQRERAQHLAGLREEAIIGSQRSRLDIEQLLLDHARQLEQIVLISGGNAGALLAVQDGVLSFRLISQRPGRGSVADLDLESPIYPGETLIVSISTDGDTSF